QRKPTEPDAKAPQPQNQKTTHPQHHKNLSNKQKVVHQHTIEFSHNMHPQQKHPIRGVSIGVSLVQLAADQRDVRIAHAVYLANLQVVVVFEEKPTRNTAMI
ncbi:MAG: hypothetical protein SPK00_04335, partial [Corynebacterium glucuronolyticum]|nr:hypothetical protein [Mycobacteriaceae bacterium]MDY5833962.1 hypothetical protein [Corynebacterium glucuronolyticum]